MSESWRNTSELLSRKLLWRTAEKLLLSKLWRNTADELLSSSESWSAYELLRNTSNKLSLDLLLKRSNDSDLCTDNRGLGHRRSALHNTNLTCLADVCRSLHNSSLV